MTKGSLRIHQAFLMSDWKRVRIPWKVPHLILLFPRCLLLAVLRNRMGVRDVGLRPSFSSYVRFRFCKVELAAGFVDLWFLAAWVLFWTLGPQWFVRIHNLFLKQAGSYPWEDLESQKNINEVLNCSIRDKVTMGDDLGILDTIWRWDFRKSGHPLSALLWNLVDKPLVSFMSGLCSLQPSLSFKGIKTKMKIILQGAMYLYLYRST